MQRHTVLVFTLIAFALAGFSFMRYAVTEEIKRAAYYAEQEERRFAGEIMFSGPYCHPDPHPALLLRIFFFVGLTAGAIAWTKSNLLPAGLALHLTSTFGAWYSKTREMMSWAETDLVSGLDRYLYLATIHDIAVMGIILFVALYFSARVISSALSVLETKRSP
jgi:hypothetical protein